MVQGNQLTQITSLSVAMPALMSVSTQMTAEPSAIVESQETGTAVWLRHLLAPCDIASVACFRMVFGGVVLAHVVLYFSNRTVDYYFGPPPYHLGYFGFEWVQALDADGMRRVYWLMAFSAVGVSLGLLYRLSAATLFVTFTYTFLAEAAQFQNHYYLMCLISFLLIFIPAHRSFSIDSLLVPEKASAVIPNWYRLLLLFQLAVPYVYGGIAKINGDWLHGLPVGIWMADRTDLPLIGPLLTERWMELFICYAGLVIDLTVVPLLLWQRTRIPAACVLIAFHLSNSVLFVIDVFPWLSILAIPMFFEPGWPRRLLRLPEPQAVSLPEGTISWRTHRLKLTLAAIFVVWQILFPFRHLLYPGNPSWTEEGQQFAWRMMLRTKGLYIRMYATDGSTGQTLDVPMAEYLTPRQMEMIAQSPYHIVMAARFFADRARDAGLKDVQIRTVVLASLNGRQAQLMMDPELDLLTVQPSLSPQEGIIPLTQPRRIEPWNVPLDDWPEAVNFTLPETVSPEEFRRGNRDSVR